MFALSNLNLSEGRSQNRKSIRRVNNCSFLLPKDSTALSSGLLHWSCSCTVPPKCYGNVTLCGAKKDYACSANLSPKYMKVEKVKNKIENEKAMHNIYIVGVWCLWAAPETGKAPPGWHRPLRYSWNQRWADKPATQQHDGHSKASTNLPYKRKHKNKHVLLS